MKIKKTYANKEKWEEEWERVYMYVYQMIVITVVVSVLCKMFTIHFRCSFYCTFLCSSLLDFFIYFFLNFFANFSSSRSFNENLRFLHSLLHPYNYKCNGEINKNTYTYTCLLSFSSLFVFTAKYYKSEYIFLYKIISSRESVTCIRIYKTHTHTSSCIHRKVRINPDFYIRLKLLYHLSRLVIIC